ncbi:unnamed protein product [Didymodactylos carnosus]|nr:unnamed protein product [Didymodactylos carnosus]CAF4410936.1 unnamed protein product [Didymodactylos carnosus]
MAAFASLFSLGQVSTGLGLSHAIGHALGASYGIPHGITSCLTLSLVIELKSKYQESASQLARALPYIGMESCGNSEKDAQTLAFAVDNLVKNLGLKTTLNEYKVPRDQAEIITERALKKRDDPARDRVLELVQKLW